jgi:hypothetical protein
MVFTHDDHPARISGSKGGVDEARDHVKGASL